MGNLQIKTTPVSACKVTAVLPGRSEEGSHGAVSRLAELARCAHETEDPANRVGQSKSHQIERPVFPPTPPSADIPNIAPTPTTISASAVTGRRYRGPADKRSRGNQGASAENHHRSLQRIDDTDHHQRQTGNHEPAEELGSRS